MIAEQVFVGCFVCIGLRIISQLKYLTCWIIALVFTVHIMVQFYIHLDFVVKQWKSHRVQNECFVSYGKFVTYQLLYKSADQWSC